MSEDRGGVQGLRKELGGPTQEREESWALPQLQLGPTSEPEPVRPPPGRVTRLSAAGHVCQGRKIIKLTKCTEKQRETDYLRNPAVTYHQPEASPLFQINSEHFAAGFAVYDAGGGADPQLEPAASANIDLKATPGAVAKLLRATLASYPSK